MAEKDEVYMDGDCVDSGLVVTQSAVESITRGEIDIQIATAHRYPRSLRKFQSEALTMATINEETAESCFYVLPRAGKDIPGPSIRLMEIAASAWGNIRYGSRTISEDDEFVTSEGVAHDLERNVAISVQVKRRIKDKYGKRYNADMIAVTANAGGSIARRNALLGVIPRAYVNPIYEEARRVAIGTQQTLSQKRENALLYFSKMGIPVGKIYTKLGVTGKEDITLDHLGILLGIKTALKENEISIDTAFAEDVPPATGTQSVLNKIRATEPPKELSDIAPPPPSPEVSTITREVTAEGNPAEQGKETPKRGVGRPLIAKTTPNANTEIKSVESPVSKPNDLPELPDDGLFPSDMR